MIIRSIYMHSMNRETLYAIYLFRNCCEWSADILSGYKQPVRCCRQDWFWIDVNLKKSFKLVGIDFVFSVKVTNILDTKNSAIINPVTGRAYEYGDDTPYGKSWNNPLYPQLQSPVTAYPYDPSRYLAGRNVLFGLSMKF